MDVHISHLHTFTLVNNIAVVPTNEWLTLSARHKILYRCLWCKRLQKSAIRPEKTHDVSWVEQSPFQFLPLRKSARKQRLLEIWNNDSGPVGTGTRRPSSGPQTSSISSHTYPLRHTPSYSSLFVIEFFFFFFLRHQSINGRGNFCDCFCRWNEHSRSRYKLLCLPRRPNGNPNNFLPPASTLISCYTTHLTCFLGTAGNLF